MKSGSQFLKSTSISIDFGEAFRHFFGGLYLVVEVPAPPPPPPDAADDLLDLMDSA